MLFGPVALHVFRPQSLPVIQIGSHKRHNRAALPGYRRRVKIIRSDFQPMDCDAGRRLDFFGRVKGIGIGYSKRVFQAEGHNGDGFEEGGRFEQRVKLLMRIFPAKHAI
ncbi:hypothetical protein SDC9_159071 [bioreactor metagenome]|uniref:Uncharacterized protein n=1 Tax=bioreactor metagenome TaxID=1076179 RepID=A0A645FHN7_9ZZZZ